MAAALTGIACHDRQAIDGELANNRLVVLGRFPSRSPQTALKPPAGSESVDGFRSSGAGRSKPNAAPVMGANSGALPAESAYMP